MTTNPVERGALRRQARGAAPKLPQTVDAYHRVLTLTAAQLLFDRNERRRLNGLPPKRYCVLSKDDTVLCRNVLAIRDVVLAEWAE